MAHTTSSEVQQPVLAAPLDIEGVSFRELRGLIDEFPDLVYRGRGVSVTIEAQGSRQFNLLWEILAEARTQSQAENPE